MEQTGNDRLKLVTFNLPKSSGDMERTRKCYGMIEGQTDTKTNEGHSYSALRQGINKMPRARSMYRLNGSMACHSKAKCKPEIYILKQPNFKQLCIS